MQISSKFDYCGYFFDEVKMLKGEDFQTENRIKSL